MELRRTFLGVSQPPLLMIEYSGKGIDMLSYAYGTFMQGEMEKKSGPKQLKLSRERAGLPLQGAGQKPLLW